MLGWQTPYNSNILFMLKPVQFQFIHLSFFQKHDVVKGKGADAQHKAFVQTTKHTLVHETNMNPPLL